MGQLNQFGGELGASAPHLLMKVMDYMTTVLEDNRLAVVFFAVGFSKAFNRLEHLTCLKTDNRLA